jgi:hypothetical protein
MANLGKYRGKVINNIDPLSLGRIVAIVPAVSELPLSWALPCVPYAGREVGFFAIPPIDANVWIEFEMGDLDYPIWTGCFWGESEVPAEPALPTSLVLKTVLGTISVNDLTAELKLELKTPNGLQTVEMKSGGIEFSSNGVTASIAQESIVIKNGASSIEITPASIGLKNGAASIELSPVTVNINNGALEVM